MTYPFTAVVGQDEARLALLLCAVNPRIGGVILSGEKGTAKSTVVRGLVELLPGHVMRTVEELENTYADIEGTIEEVSDDPAIAPNTRVGAPPQNPAGGLDLSELGLV